MQAPLSTGQRSFLCLLPSNTSGDGKHTFSAMMNFIWRPDVLGCLNIGESILVRMKIVGELDSLQI